MAINDVEQYIPEGWIDTAFGQLISKIGDGGTPSRYDATNFGGGIPWVVVEDIKPVIYLTKETLSAKGLRSSNAKLWKENSIILSFGATIGVVGIAGVPVSTKQGIAGIELNAGLHTKYIYYVLTTKKKELLRYANGTTIWEIRPATIRRYIRIRFPQDPFEQAKIAEILSTTDDAIEKTGQRIEKLKHIKRGLMQDLFQYGIDENGKIRSEATHRFKDSPRGRIPQDWETDTVGQLLANGILLNVQDGNHGELHPKLDDFTDEGVPFVMATDISTGRIDFKNCKKITVQKYLSLRIGFAKPKDVLLSHKASIGLTAVVPDGCDSIMLTPQVTYYRVGDDRKLNYQYLRYYFETATFQNSLENYAKQSTRNYIGILAQRNLEIQYPNSIDEQSRISSILSSADDAIEKEEAYRQKLLAIKRGFMEDLLSGKVRVNHLINQN